MNNEYNSFNLQGALKQVLQNSTFNSSCALINEDLWGKRSVVVLSLFIFRKAISIDYDKYSMKVKITYEKSEKNGKKLGTHNII